MRRLTTCFAALALVLAGCGDDDDTSATDTTAATVTSTSTTSAPTTTSTTVAEATSSSTTTTEPSDGAGELAQSCSSPDGFTISYPEDWEAVGDCGQFGPAPLDEPAPSTDERTGVVSAYLDPVPFSEVSAPSEGERSREQTTVDGHDAVRTEGVSGPGLYPEDAETVRWIIDAGDGRTLFVDAVDLGFDIEHDEAVEVLDRMVQTVRIDGQ